MKNVFLFTLFLSVSSAVFSQIIADHTVVDKYDDIPQYYIDKVKEMWLVYAGESHSEAARVGLTMLEAMDSRYQTNVTEGGTPQGYTSQYLRASRATWGDHDNVSGWIYGYGEEDWWTNSTAVSRTKAGITYCNTHNLNIAAIGFGWCYDMTNDNASSGIDSEYGVHWYGASKEGPEGNLAWGLNSGDYSVTGNTVCLDTYLNATQSYIDYCKANGYTTEVFFTTGVVDLQAATERQYTRSIKNTYIREYVSGDSTRILFDYADILCYDDDGRMNTLTWNGHTFPVITNTNLGDASIGHIGEAGAIRLAKAMWWMLARIAGWDGN